MIDTPRHAARSQGKKNDPLEDSCFLLSEKLLQGLDGEVCVLSYKPERSSCIENGLQKQGFQTNYKTLLIIQRLYRWSEKCVHPIKPIYFSDRLYYISA